MSAAILSGNSGVDKKYLANEGDLKTARYRFLYSCPEAIVADQRWKQFLLEPPLCDTVVAVAVLQLLLQLLLMQFDPVSSNL